MVTIKATSGSDGGTGSGIILDTQGHVLTNTHVVTLDGKAANATMEVRTSDGKVYSAKIVGTDPLSDLAVIKIDNPSGLVPATLGDSGKLNVGDTAVAIGSPLGLTGTVTDGIVSTLNRTISVASSAAPKGGADNSQGGDQGFQFAPPGGGETPSTADQGSISINVIQTDAAINPGNSGGALVNTKGEIIGVNVAIASAGGAATGSSSGNIGVGFSIPINNAKRVAQEIISTGKATHGQFGVSVKPKAAGSSSSGFSVGAEVATVESGSAADKAGLKVGDVVTEVPGPDHQRSQPADRGGARTGRRGHGQGDGPARRPAQGRRRDARRCSRAVEPSESKQRSCKSMQQQQAGPAPKGAARPSAVPGPGALTQTLTRPRCPAAIWLARNSPAPGIPWP